MICKSSSSKVIKLKWLGEWVNKKVTVHALVWLLFKSIFTHENNPVFFWHISGADSVEGADIKGFEMGQTKAL